jgi:hypothetical protein
MAVLGDKLTKKLVHGRLAGVWKTALVHLLGEGLSHPAHATPEKPGPDVVDGAGSDPKGIRRQHVEGDVEGGADVGSPFVLVEVLNE